MGDSAGRGWWCEQLDVVIEIQPGRQAVRVEGELRLSLPAESSHGPSIAVNPDQPVMRFEEVTVDGHRDVEIELNAALPDPPDPLGAGARVAHLRADRAFRRGDQLTVRFVLASTCDSTQFLVRDGFALASWTQQWLPAVLPRAGAGPGAWMQSRGGHAAVHDAGRAPLGAQPLRRQRTLGVSHAAPAGRGRSVLRDPALPARVVHRPVDVPERRPRRLHRGCPEPRPGDLLRTVAGPGRARRGASWSCRRRPAGSRW